MIQVNIMVSLMSLQYISCVMMFVANADFCGGPHRAHAFKESRIFSPLIETNVYVGLDWPSEVMSLSTYEVLVWEEERGE
jgi:hypothetical protein